MAQVVRNGHGPAESVATFDNMLTTDQKGTIAEASIVAAAVKLGIDVYRPVGEGGRYDMIFELDTDLVRVQCKWASRHGNALVVRCYSARRVAGGGIVSRGYTEREVDAFAVYSMDLDKCYFLPPELWAGRRHVYLRLAPSRNNQRLRINWAKDYEFAATLQPLGP